MTLPGFKYDSTGVYQGLSLNTYITKNSGFIANEAAFFNWVTDCTRKQPFNSYNRTDLWYHTNLLMQGPDNLHWSFFYMRTI